MGSNVIRSADWRASGTSSANTAQTITKAAASGAGRHFITHVSASFGAGTVTATGVLVELKINSTTVMSWYVSSVPLDVNFTHPIEATAGDNVQLTIGAGGASVVSVGNIAGYTS